MNMASSTMDMAAMTTTAATAAATATSTMAMDMDIGSCEVSMLWNWTTINACFISTGWRITSRSMFAGSCIGVLLLVVFLEFLRRVSKEYDGYILRQFQRAHYNKETSDGRPLVFRPNLVQQATRATLHMVQFTVAYFVMLLAMYYNGYLIICIIIGAWLGAFIFSWENVEFASNSKEDVTACCG